MSGRPKVEKGFTLLDLLVVVMVIAILAALLFPAMSNARARARRTVCANNPRQINLEIRMYSDGSCDGTPSLGIAEGSTNHVPLYSGYKELMKSYVGLKGAASPQDRLFACPADRFFPSFVLTNTLLPGTICERAFTPTRFLIIPVTHSMEEIMFPALSGRWIRFRSLRAA